MKKIQRSIINNFDLPELKGFEKFVNKIFVNIIYAESEEIRNRMLIKKNNDFIYEVYSVNTLPNLNKIFYEKIRENLYLADLQISDIFLSEKNTFVTNSIYVGYKKLEKCDDKVSLLIKTCAMDVATIEQNIKHIVKQLSSPKTFYEIVVSIDSKKENFIREYTKDSDYEKVIEIVKRLVNEKVIDRYIIFNPEEAVNINKRWFNIETEKTHSVTNVPISSQLYAFEQCMGDYILQMDSDVMIGRKDLNHDFLADMISELKKNEKVISVGFNICNPESKLYFGFENGGFVPEVRMGLFYKKRFFDLRPFPNSINEKKKLELTWYRSVEKYQKDTGYSSIRGGDNRSFFIHPQNYRKTQQHTWMNILDRIEQLEIPKCQLEHFDCEGSFYDWNIPKRNEKLIIIAYVRNVTTSQFLRFWLSIMSQNLEEIGIIIYDNCSDNGISVLIEKIVKPYKDKITYIRGRNILPKIQCEHIAIKQFCENQQSIIICIDGKNAFIGNNVLEAISECYENNMVDATCGIEYENNAIQVNYRKAVDFVRPRNENTNVGKGIISFRKYLFDSIPLDHFMYEGKNLKLSERKWLEGCEEIIKMIPII